MSGRRLAGETAVAGILTGLLAAGAAPSLPAPQAPLGGWWAAAGLAVGLLLFVVLAREPPWPPRPRRGRRAVLAAAASYLAARAAYEELLWRGFVLAALLLVTSPVVALAVSLAPWIAAHRPARGSAAAAHGVTGAAFGSLLWASGGLAAPVAAHASYNLAVCAAIERARADPA